MKSERAFPKLVITSKAARSLKNGHPWVYADEITSIEGAPSDGVIVDCFEGTSWQGAGFYNSKSKIAVRIISRNSNDVFDEKFWYRRILYAVKYRMTVMQGEDFLSDATKAEAIKKLDSLTIRVASPEDHEEEEEALEAIDSAASDKTAEGSDSAAAAETAGVAGIAAPADTTETSDTAVPADNEAGTEERILDFKGPDEGGSLVDARIAISEDTCLAIAERVNQPVDRDQWLASPQDVNAYYYPLDNSINIPAGIVSMMNTATSATGGPRKTTSSSTSGHRSSSTTITALSRSAAIPSTAP